MRPAVCVEIAALKVAQITPQIYAGFENDSNLALLLLMNDTNLRSCPALNRLRQMTQDERAACPAAFEGLLDVCKAQVTAIVTSLLSARPSQLSECYDARDLRASLYSCAASVCGPLPGRYLRIAVSLSATSCRCSSTSVLAASAAALFTKKQMKRIASGRRHVDFNGGGPGPARAGAAGF